MELGGAGGSAADKARLLREKAAKLEAEADHWLRGAEGERRTRDVLTALSAWGFVVMHDLSIPASRANIDHVVIGPTGVTVVDSKLYSGRLNVSQGVLWHGRYPLRREMEAVRWETGKVQEAIAKAVPDWTVSIRTVICIHGSAVPADPDNSLAPVLLCGPETLAATITAGSSLLGPSHVAWLEQVIRRSLPAKSIQVEETPPQSPTVPSHVPREWVSAEIRKIPRTRTPARAKAGSSLPRKRRPTLGRAVFALLGGFGLLLVGLGAVGAMIRAAAQSISATPPPGAPGSPAPPTKPIIGWSCPGKGQGWTARVTWTGSLSSGVGYQVRSASSSNGPWKVLAGPTASTSATLPLIPRASAFWVEVVAVQATGIRTYRSTSVTTSATSPSGPC